MLLTYSYSLLANLVNSMHRSNSRGGRRVLEPFYGFPVRSVGEEEVFFRPHCSYTAGSPEPTFIPMHSGDIACSSPEIGTVTTICAVGEKKEECKK